MSLIGAYDDVFAEVNSLEGGMCFIDIGANAGIFSLVAAKRVGASGSVIAFEPSLLVYRFLVANAALNGLTNFHPFLAAIGPQTSLQHFTSPARHTGAGHFAADGDRTVLELNFFADLKPLLPVLIGERRIAIKIDVEGAEGLVIETLKPLLSSPQVKKLIVEISQSLLARFGHDVDDIYSTMAMLGFSPKLGPGYAAHFNETFERTSR